MADVWHSDTRHKITSSQQTQQLTCWQSKHRLRSVSYKLHFACKEGKKKRNPTRCHSIGYRVTDQVLCQWYDHKWMARNGFRHCGQLVYHQRSASAEQWVLPTSTAGWCCNWCGITYQLLVHLWWNVSYKISKPAQLPASILQTAISISWVHEGEPRTHESIVGTLNMANYMPFRQQKMHGIQKYFSLQG